MSTSALGFVKASFTDGAGRQLKSIDALSNDSTLEYDNKARTLAFIELLIHLTLLRCL